MVCVCMNIMALLIGQPAVAAPCSVCGFYCVGSYVFQAPWCLFTYLMMMLLIGSFRMQLTCFNGPSFRCLFVIQTVRCPCVSVGGNCLFHAV
jgi:hypothetical protein